MKIALLYEVAGAVFDGAKKMIEANPGRASGLIAGGVLGIFGGSALAYFLAEKAVQAVANRILREDPVHQTQGLSALRDKACTPLTANRLMHIALFGFTAVQMLMRLPQAYKLEGSSLTKGFGGGFLSGICLGTFLATAPTSPCALGYDMFNAVVAQGLRDHPLLQSKIKEIEEAVSTCWKGVRNIALALTIYQFSGFLPKR